jgi:hypothetical protein
VANQCVHILKEEEISICSSDTYTFYLNSFSADISHTENITIFSVAFRQCRARNKLPRLPPTEPATDGTRHHGDRLLTLTVAIVVVLPQFHFFSFDAQLQNREIGWSPTTAIQPSLAAKNRFTPGSSWANQ